MSLDKNDYKKLLESYVDKFQESGDPGLLLAIKNNLSRIHDADKEKVEVDFSSNCDESTIGHCFYTGSDCLACGQSRY